MTFDEQLQRSFGTLSDHLRDELARAIQTTRAEVMAQADSARDAAVHEATARVRAEADRVARIEIERVETHVQSLAAAAAAHETARAADQAAHERLVSSVRAIDGARSLSDILNTLIVCASGEARRVAVLLTQGGQLHGWRFAGFGGAVDSPGAIVMPAGDSGILGDAIHEGGAVTGSAAASGRGGAPPFAQLPANRACFAMPISIRGEAVAVLYADQGAGPEQAPPTTAWPEALEVFARHATRCLEAATAIKAVGVLTDTPEAAPSAAPAPGVAAMSPLAGHPDEESAQRYARLLVSEIKLYNEPAVVAGRYVRDLSTRLAPEIARARSLYEREIPPEGRTIDHFHNELVRTLANGDASLLGPTP